MNIKHLLLAAGICVAAPAYADINSDLDSLVAWTIEEPDRVVMMPADINGIPRPHTIYHRSMEKGDYTFNVVFTDRGRETEYGFVPQDGKRGYADHLVFEKSFLRERPSDKKQQFHPDKITFTDEHANGFLYGTPDVIEGHITVILDGKITVRMDEEGLAWQEFEEYAKIYADEVSSFVILVKP